MKSDNTKTKERKSYIRPLLIISFNNYPSKLIYRNEKGLKRIAVFDLNFLIFNNFGKSEMLFRWDLSR